MNTEYASPEGEDEIDLPRLWGLLMDSRLLIVVVTVGAMALGVAYAMLATPVYQGDAILQVEKKSNTLTGFSELLDSEASAHTEIEIVRSRMVLGAVVDELHLHIDVRPQAGFFDALPDNRALFASWHDDQRLLRVEQLAVADHLIGQPLLLIVGEGNRFAVYHEGSLLAEGQPGQDTSHSDGAVSLRIAELRAEPGSRFEITQRPRSAAIGAIQGNLSITERGRNTGILQLSLTGEHRGRVRAILDAVARNYLLQNVRRMSAEAERSLEFLDQQLPEIRKTLDTAEEQLNAYRLQAESVDLSLETQSMLQRLVEVEARLNDLKFRESELSRLYTREHPNYRALIEQRVSLQQEQQRLHRQAQGLPETQQKILRLTRDVQLNQEIYVQLLNRAQELRIMRAGTVGNVRIIDDAQVRDAPIKPRKRVVVALATVFGFMLAVGGVLLRAVFRNGIESPEQLERAGIPVYATVPISEAQAHIEQAMGLGKKRGARAVGTQVLASSAPTDLAVEAIRSLRTSLHFAMLDANNRVLMISGPAPEVGKTFISVNLATTLAQAGQKVVVVDGDLRKGQLHRYFRQEAGLGLADYLAERADVDEILCRSDTDGLSYVTLGTRPPNPAELLMQPRLKTLLYQLATKFDLVIVDTPPVLPVTDAAIIGQCAGTSLLVTRFRQNSVAEIQKTIRRFEQNGVAIKGCIINCIEKRAGNSYSYYHYDYRGNKK